MKNVSKKFMILLLCVSLLIIVMPLGVLPVTAARSGETGDCVWSISGQTLTISGNGYMGNYSEGGPMYPWSAVKNVVIEDGVLNVGNYAFYSMETLESVVLPESVTEIGEYAFYYCESLRDISLPSSLTKIDWSAFDHCVSLMSIVLPESVKYIGRNAFAGCYPNELVIPDGVEYMGAGAFAKGDWYDGCLYAGNHLIRAQESSAKCTVREGTKTIASSAFDRCKKLEEIIIADSVEHIGSYAFGDCHALEGCNIPNSVKSIGAGAFLRCYSLETIALPDGITVVEEYIFAQCSSLGIVSLPKSVTEIKDSAFKKCTALSRIDYHGSCATKNRIVIGQNNDDLAIAEWNLAEEEHCFENAHDIDCDECGALRELSFVPGDTDGDGRINNRDLSMLQQYLNDWDCAAVVDAADVNDDGMVNNHDLALLQRYLNGWDVELK